METHVSNVVYSRRTPVLCIAIIFIYLLVTMRCWIGFGGRKDLMTFAFPVMMFGFYLMGQVKLVFKKRYVVFSIIIAITSLLALKSRLNLFGIIYQFIPALCVLFVLCLPDYEKEYVFSKIVKWFGIMMMISIPLYLINSLLSLPSFGTITADYGNSEIVAGQYANYLFYIHPLSSSASASFHRFNGPFIEPGDVGCVTSFILMATRFDFKRYKYLWAVLMALVISFSLAGYLLTLFAYTSKFLYEKRKRMGTVSIAFIVVLGVYLFGTFYQGGNNFVNETILSRLQTDEETGFSGNNRTSLVKMEYFYAMFNDTKTMLFGYDKETLEFLSEKGLGAGFVNQTVAIGFIGILGLILPYLLFAYKSSSRKYATLFFVFFLLYFFQRTETTWIGIVMSYVYGIVIYERDKLALK